MTWTSLTFSQTRLIPKILVFSFLFSTQSAAELPENRYLIKIKNTASISEVQSLFDALDVDYIDSLTPLAWHVGELSKDSEAAKKALNELKNHPQVEMIEPDYRINLQQNILPNDPLLELQHGLRRLKAIEAWEIENGSSNGNSNGRSKVVVAVSDSGVDWEHVDLENRIWTNRNEIPDNGIDDDGNGFVDDVRGWDFHSGNNDPSDPNGHGTHVAGIIGAEPDNHVGISGVHWDIQIMPLRFLGADGGGSTSHGIQTVLYAANNGAQILNMSWGSSNRSRALKDALQYASNKGVLLLAAAGNNGKNSDQERNYPSSYEEVPTLLSVASSNSPGRLSGFSNRGAVTVHFAAPGSGILSTTPGNRWERSSGTSMATPMASGVAALLLSAHPELNAIEVRNALLNGVDTFDSYENELSTAGELNALRSLAQFDENFQIWPRRVTIYPGAEFQLTPYSAQGAVSWKVLQQENQEILKVSADGLITGVSLGKVRVEAKDESGKVAQSDWIHVKERPSTGRGGIGCSQLKQMIETSLTPAETTSAAASFFLPLGLVVLFRRRLKKG
jgi:subtilisin family serine protease